VSGPAAATIGRSRITQDIKIFWHLCANKLHIVGDVCLPKYKSFAELDLIIHVSARKHGITDASMLHAVRNKLFVNELDDFTMIIGPDISGNLIEVGIANKRNGKTIVLAMKARKKYLR